MKDWFFTKLFYLILTGVLIIGCSSTPNFTKEASHNITKEYPYSDNTIVKKPTREYLIDSGDTISIFVYNHPELTQKIQVPPSGKITCLFIGDLQVAGLTISQLRDKIQSELAKGYIPKPHIAVNIQDIVGGKVYVMGEVSSPKVLYIKDEMDVIEAISQVGGFTRDAKRSAVLLIRKIEDNKRTMDVLDLENFLKTGHPMHIAMLQKGDIVYVPPSFIANVDRFFRHLSTILSPIAPNIMEGIILYPRVEDALSGKTSTIQIE